MEKYVETLSESCLGRVDLLMILVTLGTQDKPFPWYYQRGSGRSGWVYEVRIQGYENIRFDSDR